MLRTYITSCGVLGYFDGIVQDKTLACDPAQRQSRVVRVGSRVQHFVGSRRLSAVSVPVHRLDLRPCRRSFAEGVVWHMQ